MTRDEALTVRDRADLKAKYPSLKARRTQQAHAEFDAVDAKYQANLVDLDAVGIDQEEAS